MSITSFSFLVFVLAGVGVYYLLPKAWQWVALLIYSLLFYYWAATPYTIFYLVFSTLTAYISTMAVARFRKKGNVRPGIVMSVTSAALAANIIVWFVVKGRELWGWIVQSAAAHGDGSGWSSLLNVQIIAALGMGYYTLQIVGYIIDCYWENVTVQKNPLKLFLFVAYFPQLTTGPISRYAQMGTLYEGHKFQYQNIAFGAQRILWGFVKKIVLAERVGILVAAIYENPQVYTGFYSWVAILLYPLQMYADFSGCMDIVLGVSEMFGIQLAENFRNPFFARTSQEFWQRWHITLGTWAKDYVLYPLLKSKPMVKLGKAAKKSCGRKAGKFLVNLVGMFVLWMVMGIWHGGYRYIVGVSLWYWVIMMLGELFAPVFNKLTAFFHMKTDSFGWHLFQSMRTYLIYAVGAVFFSQGVKNGLALLWDAWKVISVRDYANPWIFFNGGLNLGITYGDVNIVIIVVVMLIAVACLREKYGYARIWIQKQSFPFRWLIWLGLFTLVLIWGKYGPGYNASLFIYQGF